MITINNTDKLKVKIDKAILDRLYGDENELQLDMRKKLWDLRMEMLSLWTVIFPLKGQKENKNG